MAHWHTVRQGESLPSIAARYGFVDWSILYEHGKNADFRRQRPDPHVLFPGDQLFIPSKEQRYVEAATEQTHRFRLKRQMELIRLVMEDEEGNAFGNLKYQIVIGKEVVEGTTDADGLLEAEVPAIADEAVLKLWLTDNEDPLEWSLDIGHLDPADTITGAQARLNNLGFACKEDGRWDEHTEAAVRAFQERAGLAITGELDEATQARLVEEHGS
jgi:hypothetical protein